MGDPYLLPAIAVLEEEGRVVALPVDVGVEDASGGQCLAQSLLAPVHALGDLGQDVVFTPIERVSRLVEVHADDHIEIQEAQAGDIVGIVGLKDTLTGHTLCDPRVVVQLESIDVPEPVIDVAVEPTSRADQQGLSAALAQLQREDPSLRVRQDAESGQVILSGMGELQLEVAVERLRERHGVGVKTSPPQVAYRETITKTVEVNHVHRKQTGGPGQFAALTLRVAPLPRGEGFRFENRVTGGAIPKAFVPAIEAGVRRAAMSGVLESDVRRAWAAPLALAIAFASVAVLAALAWPEVRVTGFSGGGGGGLTSSMILVSIGALITSTTLRARPLTSAQPSKRCIASTTPIPTRCFVGLRCCCA